MIDFSNVKRIVIPEGEVSTIARGSEVLWRKQSQKYKVELEYLESTGTQYIDTLLNPTDEYGYHIKNTYKYGGGEQCAIGCMDNGNRFVGVYTGGAAVSGGWGNFVGIIKSSYSFTDNDIWETSCNYKNDRKIILNGEELKDLTNIHIVGTINNTLTLFARHYGTSITKMIGKIYGVEITKGADIVADFIPVIDWNDRPCMYDKVTDTLFYNQGTGEFITGRQIHPVEYLESTGTQYIDTLYAFKDDFSWEINFEGIKDNTTIFGGRTSAARTAVLYRNPTGNTIVCPIGSSNGVATPFQLGDLSSGRHTVKMAVASSKGSVWVDGVQKYSNTAFAGTYISGTTQAIFADNFGGGNIQEYTSGKVFGLKMWQGESLICDYIPAHDENGVGFMFDRVTHTIFDNAGTGEFLYT